MHSNREQKAGLNTRAIKKQTEKFPMRERHFLKEERKVRSQEQAANAATINRTPGNHCNN